MPCKNVSAPSVNSRFARPLIDDNTIIIQTIDNRIVSLARVDGRQRWELEQTMPLLSMRGSASPIIVGPLIIAGFDNGRLAGIDMDTGDIKWDSMLSMSSGRSDLDRLSDVDGNITVVGQDVYAAGYQGRLSAIAAESGQTLWSREISSYVGVASDWNSIYTIRDDGEIIALRRNSGIEIWRNDEFLRRALTLPTPFNTAVAHIQFQNHRITSSEAIKRTEGIISPILITWSPDSVRSLSSPSALTPCTSP